MGLCKFQVQKTFIWGGVLENNINYIMGSYLIVLWQFKKTITWTRDPFFLHAIFN
jgi:hypothetical protein